MRHLSSCHWEALMWLALVGLMYNMTYCVAVHKSLSSLTMPFFSRKWLEFIFFLVPSLSLIHLVSSCFLISEEKITVGYFVRFQAEQCHNLTPNLRPVLCCSESQSQSSSAALENIHAVLLTSYQLLKFCCLVTVLQFSYGDEDIQIEHHKVKSTM